MYGAEAGGFPPVAGGRELARLGLEALPVGGAAGLEDEAAAPEFGLFDAGGISLFGVGDCWASGVGLAVVATLVGDEFCEEQADCAMKRKALKPASKRAFWLAGRNRNFIKTLQVRQARIGLRVGC